MIDERLSLKKRYQKEILVVDDNALLLRNIHVLLKDSYNVSLAKNGHQALNMVENSKPDLILLDYEMPDMSGTDVYRKLRLGEKTKDIPIIFLTSIADREVVSEVLQLKPEGYLLKPTEKEKLLNAIENVLAGKKLY